MKSTLTKLDTLINAAGRARAVAIRDEGKEPHRQKFFESTGYALLLKAFYDLSEIDAVFEKLEEIERLGGLDLEEAA